jgi:hypothetical protein
MRQRLLNWAWGGVEEMAGAGVEETELGRSFYRHPGGGRKGGDGEHRRACHDGGDGANGDEMARTGEG